MKALKVLKGTREGLGNVNIPQILLDSAQLQYILDQR